MSCKWIFKIKSNADSYVAMHKVHLVVGGFTQIEGIDFNETFSHVARMESIQVVFVVTTIEDFEVHQLNVRTIFLNGHILDEIYMQ
jgi:hypothetical protein